MCSHCVTLYKVRVTLTYAQIHTYISATQAAPAMLRTESCQPDLEVAPLSKPNDPILPHIHSSPPAFNCMVQSAAAAPAFPRAASCPGTGSVVSEASLGGSKTQRRLFDAVQSATDLDNHIMMATQRKLHAEKASKKVRRLPQAVQAIITTNRIISSKVFRTVALPSRSADPSFVEIKLRVELSALESSCVAVSAEAQDNSTSSYPKSWPRSAWQVSTDVLPVPIKARLRSHFFEYGDINPCGSIVQEVSSVQSASKLVHHGIAPFRTAVEIIAI